jgi:ankyrin repeat protein
MSALMDAVEMCDLESVKLLVAEGADVKERDGYGFVPLLWAASHDSILIMHWLLNEGGSSLAEKSLNGGSALLLAARCGTSLPCSICWRSKELP